ncbi:MAG: AMP-binding protein [Myxococcota bacterium]
MPGAVFPQGCCRRAEALLAWRRPGPFHVGVLLENVPEYLFLTGAASLAGATVVGINPTRRGAGLERDIRHTDCQILVTEDRHAELLAGLDLGIPDDRRFDVASPAWQAALAPFKGASTPNIEADPRAIYMLIFTSGTTGEPKAAICSSMRTAMAGKVLSPRCAATTEKDVGYLAMPLFHSMPTWPASRRSRPAGGNLEHAPQILGERVPAGRPKIRGDLLQLRRQAADLHPRDPERPDDADNLRVAFGSRARTTTSAASRSAGCASIPTARPKAASPSPGPPTCRPAPGVAPPGTLILDPETKQECPRDLRCGRPRLANAAEAIGEIASTETAKSFEGYRRNEEANQERTREGIYSERRSGRDAAGFFYLRPHMDWLSRVDGENFAAGPIERSRRAIPTSRWRRCTRCPTRTSATIACGADPAAGGELRSAGFAAFLGEQRDLDEDGAALASGSRRPCPRRRRTRSSAGAARRALGLR